MLVTVQLFASLRETLGDHIALEVPEPVTVGALLHTFGERHPEFKTALSALNVAVDQEYCRHDAQIRSGAEVAIFPPVSGG